MNNNLSKADFIYDIDRDVLIIDQTVDMNITGEDFYKRIKEQILENQEKGKKWDKHEDKLKELGLDEKLDLEIQEAFLDEFRRLNKLDQKNKQLTDSNEALINQLDLRNQSIDNLKQKLEKIQELLNNSYLYSETSIFESNLKEILGDKK